MKFKLEISLENVGNISEEFKSRVEEIMTALIQSGGLSGVKSGRTIIHYDMAGNFQRIELNYCPWIKRKN